MTELTTTDVLQLSDAAGRDLGQVRVESYSDGLFLGDFDAGPDYPSVEPIFRHLADVIEQASFSYLDVAEAAVARLGITIRTADGQPVPVRDIQIYPDGGFSCRLIGTPDRNGAP